MQVPGPSLGQPVPELLEAKNPALLEMIDCSTSRVLQREARKLGAADFARGHFVARHNVCEFTVIMNGLYYHMGKTLGDLISIWAYTL